MSDDREADREVLADGLRSVIAAEINFEPARHNAQAFLKMAADMAREALESVGEPISKPGPTYLERARAAHRAALPDDHAASVSPKDLP